MKKLFCALSVMIALGSYTAVSFSQTATHHAKSKPAAQVAKSAPASASKDAANDKSAANVSYQDVAPLDLVKDANYYVGDRVAFEGVFTGFHPYALDYKGAMRSSKDYISFLIQRPDVTNHVIPLSELKLVFPRKKAEKGLLDLESGDKVAVKGKVFSAALGDPWVDVDSMVIVQKSPENIAKAKNAKKKSHDLE